MRTIPTAESTPPDTGLPRTPGRSGEADIESSPAATSMITRALEVRIEQEETEGAEGPGRKVLRAEGQGRGCPRSPARIPRA